jgi:hypothetical protein
MMAQLRTAAAGDAAAAVGSVDSFGNVLGGGPRASPADDGDGGADNGDESRSHAQQQLEHAQLISAQSRACFDWILREDAPPTQAHDAIDEGVSADALRDEYPAPASDADTRKAERLLQAGRALFSPCLPSG